MLNVMFGEELIKIVNNKQIFDDYCKINGLDVFNADIIEDVSDEVEPEVNTGGANKIQKGGFDNDHLPDIINIDKNLVSEINNQFKKAIASIKNEIAELYAAIRSGIDIEPYYSLEINLYLFGQQLQVFQLKCPKKLYKQA